MKSGITYYLNQLGIDSSAKFIVACSGGADSLTLLALFIADGLKPLVAHCNFGLRGEESDEDESLVREYATEHQLRFESKRFETDSFAKNNDLSIQEAARNLRYNWFEDLAREYKYDWICVAHNRSDQLETILINLLRGSGPRGMQGMKSVNGKILRPLLSVPSEVIRQFAKANQLPFREDSSNLSSNYTRNHLRLDIIPQLKAINPGIEDTVCRQIALFSEYETLVSQQLDLEVATSIEQMDDIFRIRIADLQKSDHPILLCHRLLSDFGFSTTESTSCLNLINSQSGKSVISRTHIVSRDRNHLIISRVQDSPPSTQYDTEAKLVSSREFIARIDSLAEFPPEFKENTLYLDADKLEYPLTLRPWIEGDRFRPFGMKGSKKLSDYFIQKKLPLHAKNQVGILIDKQGIVGIIGFTIDRRCQLIPSSKRVLIITSSS
jgi:tRNA(Ile)-lysidine synthase